MALARSLVMPVSQLQIDIRTDESLHPQSGSNTGADFHTNASFKLPFPCHPLCHNLKPNSLFKLPPLPVLRESPYNSRTSPVVRPGTALL